MLGVSQFFLNLLERTFLIKDQLKSLLDLVHDETRRNNRMDLMSYEMKVMVGIICPLLFTLKRKKNGMCLTGAVPRNIVLG
jgi:hypothetical protein